MTRLSKAACALALAAAAMLPAIPLVAQTSLYATTLGAAQSAPGQGSPATTIQLASATNVAVGQGLVVDGEYETIQSATSVSTIWNVVRGQAGTQSSAHANSSVVLFGATNLFDFNNSPSGYCVSTQQTATPRVSVIQGSTNIFLCPAVNTLAGSTAASWGRITLNGIPYSNSTRYTGWTYTSAGALTIQPGVQLIGSGGALAMTLAAPDNYMDGLTMVLQASTAQAHTVTYTAGFFQNTTSSDVATFGGAIGDQLVIYASRGVWRVLTTRNVTFG